MINTIFNQMAEAFQPGLVDKKISYYFTIDDTKKTVSLDAEGCRIEDGKTTETADCVCKTSADFFVKIWNEGYRPGLKDFLAGAIKSNKPEALKTFLLAFGKDA